MSRYDDVNRAWDDRAFKRYSDFTDRPSRYVASGVVVLAAMIALVVFGGWEVGWWFKNQNINRESHALRNSYANQQTLRDQITQNIGNVLSVTSQLAGTRDAGQVAALRAQRVAIVSIVCGDAAQVVGDSLAPQQAQFIRTNCEAGNVSPSSPYEH